MMLMDASSEVPGEKKGEFTFSPFLTQGLNHKRRICIKIAIKYWDRMDSELHIWWFMKGLS